MTDEKVLRRCHLTSVSDITDSRPEYLVVVDIKVMNVAVGT